MTVIDFSISGNIFKATLSGVITEPMPCPIPGLERAENSGCHGIVLNLAGVEFINSIGITVLLNNYKYFKEKDIPVVLCSLTPQVLKVLRLARTESFIPVAEDYPAAKKILQRILDGFNDLYQENILLVQNKNNLRNDLKDALKQAKQDQNYKFVAAMSTQRALQIVDAFSINLIIIDISVPGIEVQKFIENIRLNKKTCGMPIFIATDERSLYSASYHTKNGADSIILFPFNPYSTPPQIRTGISLYNSWRASMSVNETTGPQLRNIAFVQG